MVGLDGIKFYTPYVDRCRKRLGDSSQFSVKPYTHVNSREPIDDDVFEHARKITVEQYYFKRRDIILFTLNSVIR